ncbi:MAG: type II toxin-antitoxin system VapC family toxin [Clostridia bacterium]|nr:type II toxin-antitoxin system VapC family toxin [Clostridia bacterium]
MYLLDTHAFLWFLNDDQKLPQRIRELICTASPLYISIASFWEMAIKTSLGKLTLPASVSEMMKTCEEMSIGIVPIKAAHLERLQALPDHHRDPFDRLIICQALEEKLTVLSADEKFTHYDIDILWD